MKTIMVLIMLMLSGCSTEPVRNGIDFDAISKEITVTCVRPDGSDCGK